MIYVRYTSWLSTVLDRDADEVEFADTVRTVGDIYRLLAIKGKKYSEIFASENVAYASIQNKVVPKDHLVRDGDSISFFAPIAGG